MSQKTNLFESLVKLLKTERDFVSDADSLLLVSISEAARKFDPKLLNLLKSDKKISGSFFVENDAGTFFKVDDFIRFLNNKDWLSDNFTSFSNKIGLGFRDGDLLEKDRSVVLNWPYKDCVLEGDMKKEEEKRDEVFYNETLAPDEIDRLLEPKVFTNFKKFDKDGEHPVDGFNRGEDGVIKDNLIIRGNNLLTLHSLEKEFADQIKLIYIDPPYNTGNDEFTYNDNFNHSTWLTFMKNRLECAKKLLRDDGVIYINIDDKEYSYLKVMCDEIFKKENFLNLISVKTSDPSGHKTINPSPYSQTEYILMYSKDKTKYKYDIYYISSEYDSGYNQLILNREEGFKKWQIVGLFEHIAKERGYKDTRDANKQLGKQVFLSIVSEYALKNKEKIFQPTAIADDAAKEIVKIRDISSVDKDTVYQVERNNEKMFIKGGRQLYFYSNKVKEIDGTITPAKPLTNLWLDIPYNGISKEGGVSLKNGKKPEKLLRRIIEISTKANDIVLDYHLGSGTTCAVAHKLGRRYIGIEQLNYEENDSVVRLNNVIRGDQSGISKDVNWQDGGEFIYCELRENNEAFSRKIKNTKTKDELKKIWKEMKETAMLSYKVDLKKFNENVSDFENLSLEEQKLFLFETLEKNHLYVNLGDINDSSFGISEEEKKLNRSFYKTNVSKEK